MPQAPFTLTSIPLSVLNRTLDLYGKDRAPTASAAWAALHYCQGSLDTPGPLTPLAQAVAEYMSLTGPWAEADGEYAGEGGYIIA